MNIRSKLFLGITALVFLFITLAIVLNQFFLMPFYIMETKGHLLNIARELDNGGITNKPHYFTNLQTVEWNAGVRITILSPDFSILYMTVNRGPGPRPEDPRVKLDINLQIPLPEQNTFHDFDSQTSPGKKRITPEEILIRKFVVFTPGSYVYQAVQHHDRNFRVLELGYIMKNKEILIISRPLAALEESAGVANRFLMLSGLLIFIIGLLAVYFFSRRFTKPIVELKEMAGAMAELDFSRKVSVKSRDELSELGNSVNSLSGQLNRSINELREANRRLQEDIDKERKLEEMRKDFVSSVSHELRTPISLIRGYAEGLSDGVARPDDRKYYCNVIIDEAVKMNRLLEDILDLSQVESGVFGLTLVPCNLKDLAASTLQKYAPVFKERNITLRQELTDAPVTADPARIEQVLVNFLNNALDHVSGSLSISVHIHAAPDEVRLSVYNTGEKIPTESLEKIWLRFYKTDPSRSRALGGTGLGLAIVRAILEQHGASYGVLNRDEGVEFWFALKTGIQS